MAVTPEEEAAVAKLKGGYYTATDYDAGTNPGGLYNDGHSVNMPPLLKEAGLAASYAGKMAVATASAASEVATIAPAISTVAGISEAVETVADNEAAVQSVADNMAAVLAAPGAASAAAGFAGDAEDSATAAAASAAGVNLPPIEAGDAGKALRVLGDETGYELVGVSTGRPVETKSGTYTVIAGDAVKVLSCTGSFTLTLTAAATLGNGFVFGIVNAGTGIITIDPNSSETIEGRTTIRVYPGEQFDVVCTGTAWQTLGRAKEVIISQSVISTAVAAVDITGLTDDDEIVQHKISAVGVKDTSDNGNFLSMQFYFDGVLATISNYRSNVIYLNADTASISQNANTTNRCYVSPPMASTGPSEGATSEITLSGNQIASHVSVFSAVQTARFATGHASYTDGSAPGTRTGVRFLMSNLSNNLTAGRFILKGVRA